MNKKIISIISGVSLIGATLTGAVAYDLSNYPTNFIKDGQFDGNIVVGTTAQSEDIIGAVDIGANMQYSLKQKTDINLGNNDPLIDDGYKVSKSANEFNYGDTINSVMDATVLSEDEIPSILSDGKYIDTQGDTKNTVGYTQELQFLPDTAELKYTQDDDLAPTADDYLLIYENKDLYKYSLEFDNSVEYDNDDDTAALDDLKTTIINIQGKIYTISDISLDKDEGKINKISLISGESVLWLTQNQPIKKIINGVEHSIEVVDVNEDATRCQIKIDDISTMLDIDSTKTINGLQMGVTDAEAMHSQLQDNDICQISIGATEIELEDGDNVKVDDKDFEGTEVTIKGDNGQLDGFEIIYEPRDLNDDVYLSSNDAFTDPVFNSWKIVYGGLSGKYDTYEIKANSDDEAIFKLVSNDNRDFEIPIYRTNNNTLILGYDDEKDEILYLENEVCEDIAECEGMKILGTPINGEPHIFELNNIDLDDSEMDVKDITYGKVYNSIEFTKNVESNLDLGSFGMLPITVDAVNNTITVGNTIKTAGNKIYLKNEDVFTIDKTNDTITFKIEEGDVGSSVLDIKLKADTDDDEILVYADWEGTSTTTTESDDSDETIKISPAGSKVTVDDDHTYATIEIGEDEEIYGNVFITPITSKIIDNDGISVYNLNKMKIDSTKLDTEITDIQNQNLIIVGGPCINKIAAQVMGLTYPACGASSGINENTAIIKEFTQNTGKSAIIVAGYSAENTRIAAKVLSQYDIYNLKGNTITISGTNLDSLNINKTTE